MGEELKPVRCGCGGKAAVLTGEDEFRRWKCVYRVICWDCGMRTQQKRTKAEAVTVWNRAMGAKDINVLNKERTAKVIKHKYWLGVSLNVVGEQTIGYEWLCENCKKLVLEGDDYCSHCGARLEWE